MSAGLNKQEIDNRIKELEAELEEVEGTPTEIYTRIVGYYRSLKNWNRGKREEYDHRRTFDVATSLEAGPKRTLSFVESYEAAPEVPVTETARGEIAGVLFFTRTSCPNCPVMRTALDDAEIGRKEVDVDTDEGFDLARKHEILATPTVLILNAEGAEIRRVTDPLLLKEELQKSA